MIMFGFVPSLEAKKGLKSKDKVGKLIKTLIDSVTIY